MDHVIPSNERVRPLTAYDPKSLSVETFLSANESPWDTPALLKEAIVEAIASDSFNRYPQPLADELRALIAQAYGLPGADWVMLGNGGDELIFNMFLAYGGPGRTLLNLPPTFSVYAYNAALTGGELLNIPRNEDFSVDKDAVLGALSAGKAQMAIITSPNNPTGNTVPVDFIEDCLNASDALIMADEAYMEFADPGQSSVSLLGKHKNLIILRTFSKAYTLAGLRLGYVLAHPDVLLELGKVRLPYSVNRLSQIAGREVFRSLELFEARIQTLCDERARLMQRLSELPGVQVFPSQANFILTRIPDADQLWNRLYQEHSVLVRNFCHTPGLGDCLRITVGSPEENDRLLAALAALLA